MTSRPEMKTGVHLWRGLSALALFALFALVFLGAEFGSPAGFPNVEAITPIIGYAMFDIPHEVLTTTATETESFLVAFIVVAVVLDAALEAAVMLARREESGEVVSALRSLGGDE